MTCYSCATARNRSMSLILDNDLSFPTFTCHGGVSDWPEVSASNGYRHARKYTRSKILTYCRQAHTHFIRGMFWAQRYFLISGYDSIRLCVCVCIRVYICKVALTEERRGKRTQRRGGGRRRRKRRSLCRERDWQSPHLKQASRFYNQLRNVDMNLLLLFYTVQRRATSRNNLYFTTFKAFCSLYLYFYFPPKPSACPLIHLSTSVLMFFHNSAVPTMKYSYMLQICVVKCILKETYLLPRLRSLAMCFFQRRKLDIPVPVKCRPFHSYRSCSLRKTFIQASIESFSHQAG